MRKAYLFRESDEICRPLSDLQVLAKAADSSAYEDKRTFVPVSLTSVECSLIRRCGLPSEMAWAYQLYRGGSQTTSKLRLADLSLYFCSAGHPALVARKRCRYLFLKQPCSFIGAWA